MVRKGDRPSKVPAGTFGPSTPPPPPPEAIAASRRPPPPLEPERAPSGERKRFTRMCPKVLSRREVRCYQRATSLALADACLPRSELDRA